MDILPIIASGLLTFILGLFLFFIKRKINLDRHKDKIQILKESPKIKISIDNKGFNKLDILKDIDLINIFNIKNIGEEAKNVNIKIYFFQHQKYFTSTFYDLNHDYVLFEVIKIPILDKDDLSSSFMAYRDNGKYDSIIFPLDRSLIKLKMVISYNNYVGHLLVDELYYILRPPFFDTNNIAKSFTNTHHIEFIKAHNTKLITKNKLINNFNKISLLEENKIEENRSASNWLMDKEVPSWFF